MTSHEISAEELKRKDVYIQACEELRVKIEGILCDINIMKVIVCRINCVHEYVGERFSYGIILLLLFFPLKCNVNLNCSYM